MNSSEVRSKFLEFYKSKRHEIGIWVMGFLIIFFAAALLLKKEYWKDIH
jgi:ubiquinol-cytochrome c reductase cytochrome c1 subunit